MAGSLKYFLYTTDRGDSFALKLDESNTEGASAATDFANGSTVVYELPRNVKPRFARYRSADGLVTRNCVFTAPESVPIATLVDAVSGLTLNLVSINAEEIRIPSGVDTGLLDGDAT